MRYLILSEKCPCPKCSDTDFMVVDTELDLIVGEFTTEQDATDYINVRTGQDRVNV